MDFVQILPTEDKKLIQKLNQAYGVKAEHACVYIEKKEVKATLLYHVEKGVAQVLNISTVETEIFKSLLKGFVELLPQQKITKVLFSDAINGELLSLCGVVQNGTFSVKSLLEILQNCKNC